MSRSRLLVVAAVASALALPFGAVGAGTFKFSATIAPTAVQPASTRTYTIAIQNRQNSSASAQSAAITIPAGFAVSPVGLTAATVAGGGCTAATWTATASASSIDVSAPDAASELAAGCILNVTFSATAPGAGSYTWTTAVSRGTQAYDIQGSQPKVMVDGTPPPAPTISKKPPNPNNDTTPTFEFSDSDSGATFQCQLDGGGFSACTSPKTYSVLADGLHTFSVKAVDAAGNESVPTSYSWTLDTTTPPIPTIDSHPPNPDNDTSPTFGFSDSEGGVTFQCELDGATFEACTSPEAYLSVAAGAHVFSVRAVDAATNQSAAARYSWTIDTLAPVITLDETPPNPSNDPTPTFAFSANEATPTGFECKLDAAAFEACTSPTTYSTQADGSHTFTVRASDAAGNSGQKSYTWTIDTLNPVVTILSSPADPTNQTTATFTFSSSKPGSTFQCQIDGGPYASCASGVTYNSLGAGRHTFSVKASDGQHNGLPTSYSWTIDLTPPPAASIAGGPPTPTNSTSASFVFSDSEAGLAFGCRLDGAAFSACASPVAYSGLADGAHTFSVRATDAAGNASPVAAYTWTVDTVAPNTTITRTPDAVTSSGSATFEFTSDEPLTSFSCSLDGSAFASCSSPQTYAGLAAGAHTFQVRATDLVGNTDPTPASYAWQVATLTPPDNTPPGPVRGLKRSVAYRLVKLTWALPPDADLDHVRVLVSRSPKSAPSTVVYEGRGVSYTDKRFQNGTYYRYAIVSYDHAGNASTSMTVTVPPSALLSAPRDGAVVKVPPRLVWAAVRSATFYNVQLYSPRGKLLSAWPATNQLSLSRSWSYAGRRFRLKKGLYRWFVWPGFGPRSRGRYGQLLGQSSFRVG